ncbi:MAG: hypothetical protein ABR953_07980 [Candidatus Acidiferrales bacterium]|jgi:hypothetical protein
MVSALLVLWNLGLVFQWSAGLLPNSHFDEVLYNQFRVVPGELLHTLQSCFTGGSRSADLAGE